MAIAFKSSCFLQFNKPDTGFRLSFSSTKPFIISVKRYSPVAAIKTMETVGISETFNRLKKQGKVSYIYSIFCSDSNQSFSLSMFSSVVRNIYFD
jgi:tryptophan synthase alpha chain